MIVRVFHAGRSNGGSPVNYLLSDRDHRNEPRSVQPEVLEGNPATTIGLIDSIKRKHKYVSGVMAFRDSEDVTRAQLHELVRSFKQTFLPGLDEDQFNTLFVIHREKSNLEVHFVVPMIELRSGKRLNIHVPGRKNLELYEEFTRSTNHSLGFEQVTPNPLRVQMACFHSKRPVDKREVRGGRALVEEILGALARGKFSDRAGLCEYLDAELGVTVTRKGEDYISVRQPGAKKATRLRGPLFARNADYAALAEEARTSPHRKHLTAQAAATCHASLKTLVDERRRFNEAAYAPRAGFRNPRSAMKEKNTHKGKEAAMPLKHTRKVIDNALTLARASGQIKSPTPDNQASSVVGRINSIRAKAGSRTASAANAPSFAMDAVRDIGAAIGEVQGSIDAAMADIQAARSPMERRSAEDRLAKLLEQMRRLHEQLQAARRRQLNETPGGTKYQK